jgi:hypothetical protein
MCPKAFFLIVSRSISLFHATSFLYEKFRFSTISIIKTCTLYFFYVLLQQLRNSRFGNSHFATENKKGLKQRGNHMRAFLSTTHQYQDFTIRYQGLSMEDM